MMGCHMSIPLPVVCSTWPPTCVITKPVCEELGSSHTHFFRFMCGFNTSCFLMLLSFIHGQRGSVFFTLDIYKSVFFNGEKTALCSDVCSLAKAGPNVHVDIPNLA